MQLHGLSAEAATKAALTRVEGVGKTWILDTDTKGTGAHVRPLEDVVERPSQRRPRAPARPGSEAPRKPRAPARPRRVERSSTPLAPGQVRSKATGEIGKVRSVDPKAGTAVVHWLRRGASSTVALSSLTRR